MRIFAIFMILSASSIATLATSLQVPIDVKAHLCDHETKLCLNWKKVNRNPLLFDIKGRIDGTSNSTLYRVVHTQCSQDKHCVYCYKMGELSKRGFYEFAVRARTIEGVSPYSAYSNPIARRDAQKTMSLMLVQSSIQDPFVTGYGTPLKCDQICHFVAIAFGVVLMIILAILFSLPVSVPSYAALMESEENIFEIDYDFSKAFLQPEDAQRRTTLSQEEVKRKEQIALETNKTARMLRRAEKLNKVEVIDDSKYSNLGQEEIRRQEYLEFLRSTIEGIEVIKHPRSGSRPGKRRVFLTEDLTQVYWTKLNARQNPSKTAIDSNTSNFMTENMTDVVIGMSSPTFAKRGDPKKAHLYLSIILSGPSHLSLDLEAEDEAQHHLLFTGFTQLMKETHGAPKSK